MMLQEQKKLMEKAEEISRILEMSDYMILSPRFNMALDRKDKEECLILLEQQIASIETIDSFKKSGFVQTYAICGDE